MSGHELAVMDHPANASAIAPRENYRVATDVAGVCADIVQKTAKKIQNKKYVCIEGWQAIATAHGCMLSIESVTEDGDGNVIAIASVRRMSDGATLARAEGFVGIDEKTWQGRARYARRAMAQTRAMSRAARSGFAHVVVLIDAGLSTTPFEEVGDVRDEEEPQTAPPTPPMTFQKFVEELNAAFETRGFTPEQADAAILSTLRQWKLEKLEQVQESWRATMIDAVRLGKADKFKKKAAPAAAVAQ